MKRNKAALAETIHMVMCDAFGDGKMGSYMSNSCGIRCLNKMLQYVPSLLLKPMLHLILKLGFRSRQLPLKLRIIFLQFRDFIGHKYKCGVKPPNEKS